MCVIVNTAMEPDTAADFTVENVEKVKYIHLLSFCQSLILFTKLFNVHLLLMKTVYMCNI